MLVAQDFWVIMPYFTDNYFTTGNNGIYVSGGTNVTLRNNSFHSIGTGVTLNMNNGISPSDIYLEQNIFSFAGTAVWGGNVTNLFLWTI